MNSPSPGILLKVPAMRILICVLSVLSLVFTASAKPKAVKAAKPILPEKIFPIMPWNYIPNDPKTFQQLHDCGFTVAGFVAPDGLKNCADAGLKAIVWDNRTMNYDWTKVDAEAARKNVTSLIKQVGRDPAVYGFYLRDEPPANFFNGLETVASLVREQAPGKWPYINLFPNYAENWQLATSSYEEYLEKFIAMCHPTQLSYDHYALYEDGSLGGNYWKNLEQMRAVAVKHKLPFWNIVLAVAHFSFREPTEVDLRFQGFSSLVCGARGIAYFTYFASPVGNRRGAAIDQFGNPTPTWNHLRSINLQIQKLAPTLLELTSDEVYHFGGVPNGCHGPSTNSLVTNIGGAFAVGDFTHSNGTRYVMLVNKDMSRSAPCWPQFRNPPKKLTLISQYTGQPMSYDGEQPWVMPGGGILLKLE